MLTESPQPNFGASGLSSLRWRFWLVTVLTGLAAGLAAGILMRLLRLVQWLAWDKTGGQTFLDAVLRSSDAYRVAVLVVAGLVVAATRWVLRRTTGGHGAELTEAIWFGDGRLPFWRALGQAAVSMIIVGLGASVGRESAPKQTGAAFGGLFGGWMNLSPSHRRLLAAFGAGAGVAAVYNVPFGGALFALEVLLGSLSLTLIPPALAASGLATAVAWLMLPTRAIYQIGDFPASASLIVFALVLGPCAGLLSVAYVRLIAWADRRKPNGRWRALFIPLGIFAVLGLLAIPLPQLLGNGQNVVQIAFDGQLAVPLLLALVILKPLATAGCLGSGAPGGLLTPTLTAGAMLGGLAGQGWIHVWPDAPAGAYAVLGAVAVLAAASQGPVSAVVLVLELTHRLDTLMVPVMLAAAGAVLTARLLETRSIYSGRLQTARTRAAESARPDRTISAAARYAELLQMLLRAAPASEAVTVIDQTGTPLGMADVTRARDPQPQDGPLESATAGDFARPAVAA